MLRDNAGLGDIWSEFGNAVSNTWTSITDVLPVAWSGALAPLRFTVSSTKVIAGGGGIDAVMKTAGTELGQPLKAGVQAVAPILPFVPYGQLALLALTVENLRAARAAAADNARERDRIQGEIDIVEAKIAALKAGTAARSAGSIVGAQSAVQNSGVQSPEYNVDGTPKKKIPWGIIGAIGVVAAAALL